MSIILETKRLILRELHPDDTEAFFELDADPLVHRYLGNRPLKTPDEALNIIQFVRKQYAENGIGRWAVVDKNSLQFLGWAGLKLLTEPINNHVNIHDFGYRIMRKHWGQGYATESAFASLKYGFEVLKLPIIYAAAHTANGASNHILTKVGFQLQETFLYEDIPCNWYELSSLTSR